MLNLIKSGIKRNTKLMKFFYSIRFIWLRNKKNIEGTGNIFSFEKAWLKNVVFNVYGDNNRIEIGESSSLEYCKFTVRGNNHYIKIGKDTIFSQCNFAMEDHDCKLMIGDRTTMSFHGEIAVVEPGSEIVIGADSMFSTNVDIRNTDSHSILDMVTGKRINPAKNVNIGNRVWIGAYVQVLKGVTIHDNSIVGIRSLVTKDVPSNCVVAGVPAKVVKTGIDWCKERINNG